MNSFSEAGRLYAEHYAVVQEMEKAYREDVDACVKALEARLAELVAPLKFNSYQGSGIYRQWWLGDKEAAECAYLMFKNPSPDYVSHEGIFLIVAANNPTEEQFRALLATGAEMGEGVEKRDNPTKSEMFYVSVPFESQDFVGPASARIADVLERIHAAFTGAAQKKLRNRP